jgi:hypothetical protein
MSMIIDHNPRNAYGIVGTALADTSDVQRALEISELNYKMELVPAQGEILTPNGPVTVTSPNTFLTVKRNADGSAKVMKGAVGSTYRFIQNADVVDLLQRVVNDTGAKLGAMGFTHDGARTFTQLLLPEGLTIGSNDPMNLSIMGINSHDGSSKFTLAPMATRFYCTNQLPGITRTETKFSLTHSRKQLEFELEDVRHAIDLAGVYAKEIQEIGDALVQVPMPKKEFLEFVDIISPKSIDKKTQVETPGSGDRRAWLIDNFEHAPNLDNIRNTRWAAWHTFVEYADFAKPAKGTNGHAKRIIARTEDNTKWEVAKKLLVGV